MIAIDDIRLDDRALGSDRIIQALLAATLVIAAIGVGWLVATAATDGNVRRITAIHVENQTRLPLQLTVVDGTGSRLTLGARPPGASTVFEVVDMGPTWTFVASYAGREVFHRAVPRSEVEASGWTLVIPTGSGAEIERQGFR